MHEISIVEAIRATLETVAQSHGVAKIRRVRLEIGAFASIEPEALRFAWEIVLQGSVAEAAELELLILPGRAFCYDCLKSVVIAHRLDPCPDCGGEKLMPEGGDEMRIKDMEAA